MGLLLCMMKSYFFTCRYVILYCGFCVFKVLIQLRKKDVLACSIIKKIIYWPSLFPGKDMEDHFREMEVG